MKKIILIALLLSIGSVSFAKKVTILISPSDARIYINGAEVGTGTYEFNMKSDVVVLRFTAEGYYDREVRLMKKVAQKTMSYRLDFDEATANTIGGDVALIANRWITMTVRQDMTEDVVWKRLITYVQRHFEDIEIRDRSASTIRTSWVIRQFNNETVRTRLEIRPNFSQEVLAYEIRLASEIRNNNHNSEGWRRYSRVLKKYENTITEIQAAVAGGE
jgi:hypothetical protein